MWEFISGVFKALVPPPGTDPDVTRYHWTISSLLGAVVMSNLVHVAWACGYLGTFGLTGFAQADAVSDIKAQITRLAQVMDQQDKAILAGQTDSLLQTDRKRQCTLPATNTDARELLAGKIQWELDRYHDLTGRDYRLPECSEF